MRLSTTSSRIYSFVLVPAVLWTIEHGEHRRSFQGCFAYWAIMSFHTCSQWDRRILIHGTFKTVQGKQLTIEVKREHAEPFQAFAIRPSLSSPHAPVRLRGSYKTCRDAKDTFTQPWRTRRYDILTLFILHLCQYPLNLLQSIRMPTPLFTLDWRLQRPIQGYRSRCVVWRATRDWCLCWLLLLIIRSWDIGSLTVDNKSSVNL